MISICLPPLQKEIYMSYEKTRKTRSLEHNKKKREEEEMAMYSK